MTLLYQLYTLYILLHLYVYIIVFNICFCCFATVVPRQRAVAQLSVPEIVRAMAGSDPTRQIADFDRHYMPDGQQALPYIEYMGADEGK